MYIETATTETQKPEVVHHYNSEEHTLVKENMINSLSVQISELRQERRELVKLENHTPEQAEHCRHLNHKITRLQIIRIQYLNS